MFSIEPGYSARCTLLTMAFCRTSASWGGGGQHEKKCDVWLNEYGGGGRRLVLSGWHDAGGELATVDACVVVAAAAFNQRMWMCTLTSRLDTYGPQGSKLAYPGSLVVVLTVKGTCLQACRYIRRRW